MDDVKTLLDGDGNAAPNAVPAVLASRPGSCADHGEYTDQQIPIRSYVGYKAVALPYWLGCPECRRLGELANKLEAKRWTGLQPGEPSWALGRR